MKELIDLLDSNNIKYNFCKYGYDTDCIEIKKNKYRLLIYLDNEGDYASDLQEIPYNWGRSGFTTIDMIIDDLREYLKIDISYSQLSFF